MMNLKQAQLRLTLQSIDLLKLISSPSPIARIATDHLYTEIRRTVINQAGEIDTLTGKLRNLTPANNNYEIQWDSLIFSIMGADAKADIIDGVDIERITTAAIAAIKKLASARDENQRVAEAFQAASHSDRKIMRWPYYQNALVAKTHELKIAPEYLEAVICGQKTAETRINDRDFKVNDHLILREWENDGYTGWEHEVVITHVCDFPYVVTGERWVSLSISPVYGLDPDAVSRYLNSRRISKAEATQ